MSTAGARNRELPACTDVRGSADRGGSEPTWCRCSTRLRPRQRRHRYRTLRRLAGIEEVGISTEEVTGCVHLERRRVRRRRHEADVALHHSTGEHVVAERVELLWHDTTFAGELHVRGADGGNRGFERRLGILQTEVAERDGDEREGRAGRWRFVERVLGTDGFRGVRNDVQDLQTPSATDVRDRADRNRSCFDRRAARRVHPQLRSTTATAPWSEPLSRWWGRSSAIDSVVSSVGVVSAARCGGLDRRVGRLLPRSSRGSPRRRPCCVHSRR